MLRCPLLCLLSIRWPWRHIGFVADSEACCQAGFAGDTNTRKGNWSTLYAPVLKYSARPAACHNIYINCIFLFVTKVWRSGFVGERWRHQVAEVRLVQLRQEVWASSVQAASLSEAVRKVWRPRPSGHHGIEKSMLFYVESCIVIVCDVWAADCIGFSALSTCSVELLLKIGTLLPELAVHEKVVDQFIQLLRKDQVTSRVNWCFDVYWRIF